MPLERGAANRQDYGDRPGWRGKLNFPCREIAAMVDESLELKQPLLLHAVSDKSIEVVLSTLENHDRVDRPAQCVRLEHGDGLIVGLIPRAGAGCCCRAEPIALHRAAAVHPRWGASMQPMRTLIESGNPLALGSDGPMNPYLNIMFAAIHPSNLQEAITREQAVLAYTHQSAFAEFAEQDKGSIAAGKLADLTVLSQDIFAVPIADLPNTRSVLTLVGGKPVFDAKVLE